MPNVLSPRLFFQALAVLVLIVTIYARLPAPPVNTAVIKALNGRFVTRPDGRTVEYFTCGEPSASPVYLQHGYGNSGLLFTNYCNIARKLGLYIISVSMPGFGLSSAYPPGVIRSLSEWPADVYAVLEAERVNRFYAAGFSAGCVHVAAVAAADPSRVLGVAFFSPTAPDSAAKSLGIEIAPETKVLKHVLRTPYVGDVLALALARLTDAEGRMAAAPDCARALQKMRELGGEMEALRAAIVADGDRACAHTHRGWSDNTATMCDDLPFDLAKVGEVQGPIVVTSSADDTTNAPGMQQWFAGMIPGAELAEVETGWGHVHITIPEVLEKYLGRIMQR